MVVFDLETRASRAYATRQMHVDQLYLRERMRSLPAEDLRRIVENERCDYTPAAVEAAQDELTERPPVAFDERLEAHSHSGFESADESLRSSIPFALWGVFCVASGTAVLAVLVACIVLTFVAVTAVPLSDILGTLRSTVATAVVAFWLAAAIRAERAYAQVLLLSLIAGGAVYRAASVVINWPPTREELDTLGVIAVAFWYFTFSDSISGYYRALRRSGHEASPSDNATLSASTR